MSPEEQLNQWLVGNSIHNDERGECCPDFSCCKKELLADKRTREVFCASNDTIRHQMLIMFLGSALALATADKNTKVYISEGLDIEGIEH